MSMDRLQFPDLTGSIGSANWSQHILVPVLQPPCYAKADFQPNLTCERLWMSDYQAFTATAEYPLECDRDPRLGILPSMEQD